MTEKTDKNYLKEAVKNMKELYKKLGHSPKAAEYDRISESQFKLRALYKNNIKLNQLKEAAGVPIRKSGTKVGAYKGKKKADIFCQSYGGKIAAAECIPGYKKKDCKGCKERQKENVKAIPDIPEEIEQLTKYDGLENSKHMNGNGIYMTDVGAI
jgi:hypothetical protein